MDEKEIRNILTEILYVAINELENTECIGSRLTPDTLARVYLLAKKHDLAHVVYDFVRRCGTDADAGLLASMQKDEFIAVYRDEQIKYAYEQICRALDGEQIAYIPLKGAVIRHFYPRPEMRTSCDIDILIRGTDLDAAIACLCAKGYRCGERNYHDVSLYSPNNIHLELHFSIQENMDNLDAVLKDAWEYAVPANGSRYMLTDEFFVFHIFAHMAYHFVTGGCGIRALLDIWVMEHKMGVSYRHGQELFKKAGIDKFAAEMSRLADLCFTKNTRDDFADKLLEYIFEGGVYGNAENRIALGRAKNKNSVGYALKRLFPPCSTMEITYPMLKKVHCLLPFCWMARWIKVVFGADTGRIAREMSWASNIPKEKVAEIRTICMRLGL